MLQKIRAGAQTFGAKVVAGVICFVLVVFGFGAFNLFAVNEPAVARVNGEKITASELDRAVVFQRQNLNRMYGGELSPEYLESIITQSSVLQQLINNRLVKQKANEIGFAFSRQEFVQEIQSNPAFQQDGEFDPEQFVQALNRAGYSPQSYEQNALSDRVIDRLVKVQSNSSFVTDREVRDAAAIAGQTRDIAYVVFHSNSYLEGIEPDEEEIRTYYEENSDSYMSPEEYEIAYVMLDRSSFESGLLISNDELLEAYEAEKAVAESNAERKASHILLEVDDSRSLEDAIRELQSIREGVLVDGLDFAEIARELSQDVSSATNGGDLGFAGRGTYVPEFEATLFNMEVGEISQPFETTFGVHIIQLHEIAEVDHPPFEERTEELRQILLAEKATPQYEEAIAEMSKIAYEQSQSLEPVATALGLEIQTAASVSRSDGEVPFDSYSVRNELLSGDVLSIDVNSKPITVSESQSLVGRVVSRTDPMLRPLEEVQPRIVGTLKSLEARKRAEEERDAVYAKIQETEDYSAVANEFGFEWTTQEATTRENEDVEPDILDAAFNERLAESGEREIMSVDISPIEFGILVVSRMDAGDYEELPLAQQTTVEDSLKEAMENLGLSSFIASLRDDATVKYIVPELAAQR